MKLVLAAGQVAVLRPWLDRRGISLMDAQVGHVTLVTGSAGPRMVWVDADGLTNEDFLDEGDWSAVQRLLKVAFPQS